MAITIAGSPSGTSSVQDALWHISTSDNSGTTDFKFVFDVYVDGVQKIRVKKFPDPTTGRGYFDAGPTVRNEMVYDWFSLDIAAVLSDTVGADGKMAILYDVRYGEEVSGVTTANMASGTTTAYNWVPNLFKRRITTLTDKQGEWLTNRPLIGGTKIGENLFIPFYVSASNSDFDLFCKTYDYSNNLVDTQSLNFLLDNEFNQFNIGTVPLFNDLNITIGENIKYYDVYIVGNVSGTLETFRVYLTCNPKYDPTLIHFLNRWGMWDTQRFDLVSRLNMDVQRSGFEKKDYVMGNTNVDYTTGNKYLEGKINYHQSATWIYKLTADAMSDDDYTWMSDLIVSPQILMEVDGYFYPVTIKDTSYEYSKYVNNRLRPLQIDFEMNQTRYSQLR